MRYIYNYFTYDVERIKFQNNNKLNRIKQLLNKEKITPGDITLARILCKELVSLTEEKYFKRFVDNPTEMSEKYMEVFGVQMPTDVLGIKKLQEEVKLQYNRLLIYLVKYREKSLSYVQETDPIKKSM